jgi:predicted esterase
MSLLEEKRAALLDGLRRSHRAEGAPAQLRQRVLDRLGEEQASHPELGGRWSSRWLSSVSGGLSRAVSLAVWAGQSRAGSSSTTWDAARRPVRLGLPLLALVAVALPALLLVSRSSELRQLALGPEPPAELRPVQPRPEPSEARAARAEQHPCPLSAMPAGAAIRPRITDVNDQRYFGVVVHAFDMEMPSCGTITRRYLAVLPEVRKPRATAPVLLVLHDTGQSAETMRVNETRWHLDEMAKREGFIVVYANAAPGAATRVDVANSGGWATDERTHPEIEDDVYLQRVVNDLIARELIGGANDVFLLGYGGGATMALDAAARQPLAYAGVAAFMPRGPEYIEPPVPRNAQRLSRVLFVLSAQSRLAPDLPLQALVPALATRWGQGLDIARAPLQRRWQLGMSSAPTASVQQLDVAMPASGSAAVRVLVLDPAIDPFSVAPVGPRLSGEGRRSSEPPRFDGARQAWAYLTGAEGTDPSVPSEPYFGDRLAEGFAEAHSVPGDDTDDMGEDFDVPSVVLEEDVVKARQPGEVEAPRPGQLLERRSSP